MRKGDIKCECGYNFYYETIFETIECLMCKKSHETNEEDIEEIVEISEDQIVEIEE